MVRGYPWRLGWKAEATGVDLGDWAADLQTVVTSCSRYPLFIFHLLASLAQPLLRVHSASLKSASASFDSSYPHMTRLLLALHLFTFLLKIQFQKASRGVPPLKDVH